MQSSSSLSSDFSERLSSTKDLEKDASTQNINTDERHAVERSTQPPTESNNRTFDRAGSPQAEASGATPRPLSQISLRARLRKVSTDKLIKTLAEEAGGGWTAPRGFNSVPQPGLERDNQEPFIQKMLIYREDEEDPLALDIRFGLLDSGAQVSLVYASTLRELGLRFYRIAQDAVKGLADPLVEPIGLKPMLWCDEGDENNPPMNWTTNFLVLPEPLNGRPQFDFLLGADFCSAAKLKLERPQGEQKTLSFLALRSQQRYAPSYCTICALLTTW